MESGKVVASTYPGVAGFIKGPKHRHKYTVKSNHCKKKGVKEHRIHEEVWTKTFCLSQSSK
jgi:hypothetical protein